MTAFDTTPAVRVAPRPWHDRRRDTQASPASRHTGNPRPGELSIVGGAGVGGAALLLFAFAGGGVTHDTTLATALVWMAMGVAMAALAWWAACIGRPALWIYRSTMLALVAMAALRALHDNPGPALADPVGLVTVGFVGLAFSWIPGAVVSRVSALPDRGRNGRH